MPKEGAMNKTPSQEIERRISRFQEVLAEKGLDGAFINQNVDLYYFSGTLQRSVLFVPCQGDPLLMVEKSFERARKESPLKDLVPIKGRRDIPGALREGGHNRLDVLGLEMDVLPASRYLWYQRTFPQTKWRDISNHVRALRMTKSPYEVALIEEAASILHTGFTEIRSLIKEGMTELEVDGHLALIARREGHMGVLRMRSFNQEMTHAHVLAGESGAMVSFCDTATGGPGATPAMAQGAGWRTIGRNEPIGIDYGVGVGGYLADQFRTCVLGRLPSRLEEAHHCAREIHRLLVREGKPGVSCAKLYRLAEEEASRSGFGDFFMGHGEGRVAFIGHGIGLEIDEYPIISKHFAGELAEGMVFALEPKFVFPHLGVVGLEDDYLVTASGLKRLTLTEQSVLRI